MPRFQLKKAESTREYIIPEPRGRIELYKILNVLEQTDCNYHEVRLLMQSGRRFINRKHQTNKGAILKGLEPLVHRPNAIIEGP